LLIKQISRCARNDALRNTDQLRKAVTPNPFMGEGSVNFFLPILMDAIQARLRICSAEKPRITANRHPERM
jgi:hypothetical protein